MTAAESRPRRRRRERVVRSDGVEVVQTKPPRADVLWYPGNSWATVLVRRTHDPALAAALAEERWNEIGSDAPLTTSRVGWWRTYSTTGDVPAGAAVDHHGRIVQWCDDRQHSAGPGIEFRP